MPIPAAWSTVPVTWDLTSIAGACRGKVRFSTEQSVTVAGDTFVPAPLFADVVGGIMETLALPVTDDPDVTPTGWLWKVQPLVNPQGPDAFYITAPTAGGAIDLGSVVPVEGPAAISATALADGALALIIADAASLVRAQLDLLVGSSPASETQAGKIEIATQAETNAGTDDARAITPLKLQTRMAAYAQQIDADLTAIAALSTTAYGRALLTLVDQAALTALISTSTATVSGIVELATDAETVTGTDSTRAATPSGVAAALSSYAQPVDSDLTAIAALATTAYGRAFLSLANQAALMALLSASSETASGIVELATQAETNTGTDDVRAVTPLKLQTRLAAFAQPLDSDLTSIAALATTSYGRGLLTLADQAALTASLAAATESLPGIAEIATQAETNTGTDDARLVTPLKLQTRMAAYAQPLDSDLTTIAGLTATTDNVVQSVAGAWASRTPAQVKATLALTKTDVGLSNVDNVQQQPLDTDLTAIAALTSAADKLPYATGAGTWALTTCTAAARTLLDDVDVAAMRATLSVLSQAQLETLNGLPSYAAGSLRPWEPVRGIYNLKSSNTRIMGQGLGNAMLGGTANGGQTEHIVIGDSVSAGVVASLAAGAYAFDRLRAWPLAMRDQLANAGIPGNGTGLIRIVDGGAGIDARVTVSGTWTGFLWGSRTTVNGSAFTVFPEKSGTVVDVWYYDGNGMTFTISVDGAASGPNFATVNTANSGIWKNARLYGCNVIANVSNIKVTVSTATAGFYTTGLSVWTPNTGLIVHNVAQSGATASGTGNAAWVDNSAANVLGTPYLNAAGRKRAVTDASSTTGSSTLTSATAAFTANDLGKSIDQTALGAPSLMFPAGSYIGAILSGTTVTMYSGAGSAAVPVNAINTLSSQSINIGRDPSCVHIALGLNDLITLGASDATITAAISTIRGRFSASDCILHLVNEPSTTLVSGARMLTFQAAMYALADTLDVPLYDWRDRVGTFANGQATGVYGDNAVHITSATSAGLGADMASILGAGNGRGQTASEPVHDADIVPLSYINRRKVKTATATALTTVETPVLTLPIPAGKFVVGDLLRYALWLSPAATTITTVRVRIGTTGTISDGSVIVMSATAATNAGARYCEGQTGIAVIGASATHIGGGTETVGAISAAGTATAATGTFNSTVTNYVTVTVQNTSSTTTTVRAGILEWV